MWPKMLTKPKGTCGAVEFLPLFPFTVSQRGRHSENFEMGNLQLEKILEAPLTNNR